MEGKGTENSVQKQIILLFDIFCKRQNGLSATAVAATSVLSLSQACACLAT